MFSFLFDTRARSNLRQGTNFHTAAHRTALLTTSAKSRPSLRQQAPERGEVVAVRAHDLLEVLVRRFLPALDDVVDDVRVLDPEGPQLRVQGP